jgi:type VI secretion system protein ImpF
MADVQRRLLPTLLERLTDDDPHNTRESAQQRAVSGQGMRRSLIRDLEWLFNTTALGATEDLADYPEVAASVLNYGLPTLTGQTLSTLDPNRLERQLREVLLRYEPRILPGVRIRVVRDNEQMSSASLRFDLEGELRAQPAPLYLLLRTEMDVATQTVNIQDLSG